jgi:hypothetical protein
MTSPVWKLASLNPDFFYDLFTDTFPRLAIGFTLHVIGAIPINRA